MLMKITDVCISFDACLDECPIEAIVDNDEKPTGGDVMACKDCKYNGGAICRHRLSKYYSWKVKDIKIKDCLLKIKVYDYEK